MAGELILIIDDNSDVRILLGERVLPSHGYRALTATDGQEGLWQIRTQKPDLILLDLRLPDMTGLDLLHILSSEGYDTPVILITAYGSELIAAQALRLGVRDYIIKPFTLDEIVDAVERALTERRLRQERNGLTDHLRYYDEAMRVLALEGAQLSTGKDVDSQLCDLVEMAVAATRSQAGRVWLYEPVEEALVLRAAQDAPDQPAYPLRRRNDSSQLEEAFAGQTFQQWTVAQDDDQEKSIALAAPIFRSGRPFGVLEVHMGGERLSAQIPAPQVLQVLATWGGVILEQAHLRDQTSDLERHVESVITLSPDLLLVLDEEDRIVSVSPAVEAMTGQHPDAVVGQDVSQWIRQIGSEQEDLIEWYLSQSRDEEPSEEGQQQYALRFRGADGQPRQAEIQVLLQRQDSGVLRRYLLFRDRTVHHRLEQEIRLLRRELGEGGREEHVGLLLTDIDGTVLSVNRTALNLLQCAAQEVLDRPLWEIFPAAEGTHLFPEGIARAYREGSGYVELRWSGRTACPLGLALLLLLGVDETPHAIVVLARPVHPNAKGTAVERPAHESDLLGRSGVDS